MQLTTNDCISVPIKHSRACVIHFLIFSWEDNRKLIFPLLAWDSWIVSTSVTGGDTWKKNLTASHWLVNCNMLDLSEDQRFDVAHHVGTRGEIKIPRTRKSSETWCYHDDEGIQKGPHKDKSRRSFRSGIKKSDTHPIIHDQDSKTQTLSLALLEDQPSQKTITGSVQNQRTSKSVSFCVKLRTLEWRSQDYKCWEWDTTECQVTRSLAQQEFPDDEAYSMSKTVTKQGCNTDVLKVNWIMDGVGATRQWHRRRIEERRTMKRAVLWDFIVELTNLMGRSNTHTASIDIVNGPEQNYADLCEELASYKKMIWIWTWRNRTWHEKEVVRKESKFVKGGMNGDGREACLT